MADIPKQPAHVIAFPWDHATGAVARKPRVGWLFRALDGHENPKKKRLLLTACDPDVAIISREDAAILIAGLGLADA
jgi:hypothetical protein